MRRVPAKWAIRHDQWTSQRLFVTSRNQQLAIHGLSLSKLRMALRSGAMRLPPLGLSVLHFSIHEKAHQTSTYAFRDRLKTHRHRNDNPTEPSFPKTLNDMSKK